MELKPTYTTGALPFSKMAVEFLEEFLSSSLFPARNVAEHWGTETVFATEFLDLYAMSSPQVQRAVFPLIDPEYYLANAKLADPDENLLEHFLLHGVHLEIDPHPLISFDWMRFSRPDLFERALTPHLFFSIFESNLLSTSPFFDIAYYKRITKGARGFKSAFVDYVLRGADLGLSPCRWFDVDHYRETYPDVPEGGMPALLHFMQVGDAEMRSPSERFDPTWYQEQYSNSAHQIEHPLHHFLRWGRMSRHAPSPEGRNEARTTARNHRMDQASVNLVYDPKPDEYRDAYRRTRSVTAAALSRALVSLRDPAGAAPAAAPDRQPRRRAAPGPAFSASDAPRVEVVIHNATKLFPVTRSLRSLRLALQALPDHDVAVTVVFDQATQEQQAASQLANKAGGVRLAHWQETAPLKTRAPYVLFLSAGTELGAQDLTALTQGLHAHSGAVAVAPLIVNSQGGLVAAGGMTHADGSLHLVGQGMTPRTCPWARDRAVPWAPLTAMLVERAALDAAGPGLWSHLQANRPVDLAMALRQQGGSLHLVAQARAQRRSGVRHPARDQAEAQRIVHDHGDQIARDLSLKVIAQFFPHFSPDPVVQGLNGAGTTDWYHVGKTHPGFVGHYQPHIPADLGYYDSRLGQVLDQQIALARQYGVDGFLLRYYNLSGQRVLGDTFDQLCQGRFDGFQHALCWDTRGIEDLVDPVEKGVAPPRQSFDDRVLDAVLEDAVAAARVQGCLQVDGKPLFVVSDIDRLPDAGAFAQRARRAFQAAGFDDVHLAMLGADSQALSFGSSPADFGFDSLIQEPPRGIEASKSKRGAKTFRALDIQMQDYRDIAAGAVRGAVTPYRSFPGLCAGWDDTPRRRLQHRVLLDQSPAAFQAWMHSATDVLDQGVIGDDRMLFVTAWNHWAAGAHLEPDLAFGHAWLQALRAARHQSVVPASLPAETRRARASGQGMAGVAPLAIVIHAYYLDVFSEMLEMIVDEGLRYPLYITCPEQNAEQALALAQEAGQEAKVFISANHGRDLLPFLQSVHQVQLDGHKYLLKLHTKKSPHRTDGHMWRKELFGPFLNGANLERIVAAFETKPELGMTGPGSHILPLSDHFDENQAHVTALCQRLNVDAEQAFAHDQFVAGTMFFARFSTLLPILKLGLRADEFEDEAGQVDGTLAHALERVFGLGCRLNGRKVVALEDVLGGERRRVRGRNFHQ